MSWRIVCPHCRGHVAIGLAPQAVPAVGPKADGIERFANAAPVVPIVTPKPRKGLCGCGHDAQKHDGEGGRCTHGHGTQTGGCDCPGFHSRRRGSAPKAAKPTLEGELGKGERALLVAIIQQGVASRAALSILTGYRATSLRTYLGRLKSLGFVFETGGDWYATDSGRVEAGPVEPLPTGEALRRHYIDTLPEGESTTLAALVSERRGWSPGALQLATGYKATSIRTFVGKLVARRLVERDGRDVRASAMLFDNADPHA